MGFLITLKYAIGEVFKIRALATIPGVIAISIWLFSMLLLFLDRRLQPHLPDFLQAGKGYGGKCSVGCLWCGHYDIGPGLFAGPDCIHTGGGKYRAAPVAAIYR